MIQAQNDLSDERAQVALNDRLPFMRCLDLDLGLHGRVPDAALVQAGERDLPLVLDTFTLDHPVAFENYRARGLVVTHGRDQIYLDPRRDGTVRPVRMFRVSNLPQADTIWQFARASAI